VFEEVSCGHVASIVEQHLEIVSERGVFEAERRQSVGTRLVARDVQQLVQIRSETLSTISTKSIDEAGDRFTGKMVLVGDATNAQDSFPVVGHGQIAGCYVIASAAYSLAVDPLFEFNLKWRLIFDFLFATTQLCFFCL